MSETARIRPIIERHLAGKRVILDIGCGDEKITPDAIGIDMRHGPAVDLVISPADIYNLQHCGKIPPADVVFSSHCLEHTANWMEAVRSWAQCLRIDGKLILYLPDGDHYDNSTNKEHVQDFKYERFVETIIHLFGDRFGDVDHGVDYENGGYSFWVVLQ